MTCAWIKKTAEQIYDSGKEKTISWMMLLDAKVDELTEKVAKLSKNSSNSSKPPSSDIVKPGRAERRRDNKKRPKGGQPGHPKWERIPFAHDEVTPIEHTLAECPHCAGPLEKLRD